MRIVLKLAGVVTVIAGIFVFFAPSSEPLPGSLIGPPSLSPDGRVIAFTYGMTINSNNLLLYDIESEQLRLIDKPLHLFVRQPSFSPDSQRLAVSTYCNEACEPDKQHYQIATIDLDSGELTFLTSGGDFARSNPIYSADGRSIFFDSQELTWRDDWLAAGKPWPWGDKAVWRGRSGLSEVDLDTGETRALFPSTHVTTEFYALSLGRALPDGSILFSAIAPHGGEVATSVSGMEREHDSLGYIYHPEYGLRLHPENDDWRMNSLSSSEDGTRRVFVSANEQNRYDYDLYQSTGGRVSAVTSLKTHMAHADVSANGVRVVFLADKTRQKNWSVWLHDFVAGETQLILQYETIQKFLGLSEDQESAGVSTM